MRLHINKLFIASVALLSIISSAAALAQATKPIDIGDKREKPFRAASDDDSTAYNGKWGTRQYAQPNAAIPDAPPPPPAVLGAVLDVKQVYFIKGTGGFDFNRPETLRDLNRLKAFLDQCSEVQVDLVGHTSNEGPVSLNNRLSGIRANLVRKWLIDQGVPSTKIKNTKGVGSSVPASFCPTQESKEAKSMDPAELESMRARNRRLEATVVRGCPQARTTN